MGTGCIHPHYAMRKKRQHDMAVNSCKELSLSSSPQEVKRIKRSHEKINFKQWTRSMFKEKFHFKFNDERMSSLTLHHK